MTVPAGDLDNIRTKVRRLTRNPTEAQLATGDLDEYINTFILFDFPEHLRLFTLRETFEFFTIPNIDQYDETNTPTWDPNVYITVHQPVFLAGRQGFFTQSREEFFLIYPMINFDENIATGNGGVGPYTATLTNVPLLRNKVTVSATDTNGTRRVLEDDGNGVLIPVRPTGSTDTGTINYTTGAISVTFNVAIASPNQINAQYVPYVAARPESILFFDQKFILRPVPDQTYRISVEVYKRPTALLAAANVPELTQWWQYIAFGAALKVLEDRMDLETYQKIYPLYKEQEKLVLRKTIVQQTNERTATIFSEQVDFAFGNFFNNFGGF